MQWLPAPHRPYSVSLCVLTNEVKQLTFCVPPRLPRVKPVEPSPESPSYGVARKLAEGEYKRAFLYFDFSAQTPFSALLIVQNQSKQRRVLI